MEKSGTKIGDDLDNAAECELVLLLLKCKEEAAMESALSIKGQATIPKAIRDHLHVGPGDRIKFFLHPDGSVVILPKIPTTALKGMVPARRSRPVSLREMETAIAQGASSGDASSKGASAGIRPGKRR
jgi:antitoxin PrlF